MNTIKNIVIILLSTALVITNVALRFRHPELTEPQIFINYWYLWLGYLAVVIVMVVLSVIFREKKNNKR